MDPTGNVTILVETPVPAAEQCAVAAKLMELEPTAEQVGFLESRPDADVALRMAGGEFCANAAMSAAVLAGMDAAAVACACCERIADSFLTVSVSGAEPIVVELEARAGGDDVWQGTVRLPRPLAVETVRFADGQTCPVVTFDGIVHVILECAMPREDAEALARRRCAELHADALGLMFLDRAEQRLTPLVYVPLADTMFWENSCGSGTAAVGAYLAKEQGTTVRVPLRQPGGTPEITASPDGALRLRGSVRFVHRRTVETDI